MDRTERLTFKKKERLCKKKLIEEVFENGLSFNTSLFRIYWLIYGTNLPSPAQIAISVPKRSIKLAVSRNLVKRRFREAYRKHKSRLYEFLSHRDKRIVIVVIYRHPYVYSYDQISKSVDEMIDKLCTRLNQNNLKS